MERNTIIRLYFTPAGVSMQYCIGSGETIESAYASAKANQESGRFFFQKPTPELSKFTAHAWDGHLFAKVSKVGIWDFKTETV